MFEPSSSALTPSRETRLSRYCAAGAGAAVLAGTVTTADASIVFVNFNNQVIIDTNTGDASFSTFNFDLNGDGTTDFRLGQRISGGTGGALILSPTGGTLGVVGITSSGFNYGGRLAAGFQIGPSAGFVTLSGTGFPSRASLVSGNGFPGSQWVADPGTSATGYLGIQFTIGGQLVYGWLHLSISDGTGATPRAITLIDAAYETAAGTVILAGAVPEPSTITSLGLVALGSVGLIAHRRRKASAAA